MSGIQAPDMNQERMSDFGASVSPERDEYDIKNIYYHSFVTTIADNSMIQDPIIKNRLKRFSLEDFYPPCFSSSAK